MKVCLLQAVKMVGEAGEIVDVKDGFGRNFLLAQNLASLPGDKRCQEIREEQASSRAEKKSEEKELQEQIERLNNKTYRFEVKTDKAGNLYGSIGPKDISAKSGLPEKVFKDHFKEVGNYEVVANYRNHPLKMKIEIVKK